MHNLYLDNENMDKWDWNAKTTTYNLYKFTHNHDFK